MDIEHSTSEGTPGAFLGCLGSKRRLLAPGGKRLGQARPRLDGLSSMSAGQITRKIVYPKPKWKSSKSSQTWERPEDRQSDQED